MTDTSFRGAGGASAGSPHSHGEVQESVLRRRLRGWLSRLRPDREAEASLRETLEELIEEREEEAPIADDERALIANILKLRSLTATDVAVPRADIVAVEVDTPMDELAKRMVASAHSRLPVYRETLDDVVGMVHIKDVFTRLASGQSVPLRGLLRKVLFVSPAMRAMDLLLEMRAVRTHMALVVDEFGGIDGLVTIEDLVEEIVGEIEDEHDETEAPRLVDRPDGSVLADARATIEELEARVGPIVSPEERADIDTIGGLVVSLIGRVPARGELVRHPSGLEFEVIEADARRVKRLRVIGARPPAPAEEA
ncbi:MAG: HlyC/CorC family transporter [Proteobacteria bacterium]|nr:HlyC/CorC family transporter [Pseudomonadota bacterium]MBI3499037.1 HlyC/CorC family transporter [Pseudomonadota bacterium]